MPGAGLWGWMRGYAIIIVTGRMLEKFINSAAAQGVELRNVALCGRGCLMAHVSLADYRKLGPVLRACGCRASVQARVGAPFLAERVARRSSLAIGLLLFIVVLYGLSSLVWRIDVIGVEPGKQMEIRDVLARNGVRRFVWRARIDCDYLRREITRTVDGLAWAGVELHGTTLVVRGADKVLPDTPEGVFDIVSAQDAVVSKLIPLAGDVLVREGDTVVAGQVLVRGRPAPYAGAQPVHARALVEGRVWRECRVRIPLVVQERVRTGRSTTSYTVRVGGRMIALGRPGRYSAYDTEEFRSVFRGWRAFPFDVEITKIIRRELVITTTGLSREEAYLMARRMALGDAARLPAGAQTVSVTEHVENVGGGGGDSALPVEAVEVSVVVETIENIASQRSQAPRAGSL